MSDVNSAAASSIAEMKPIVGTGMSRFLNQYNPAYDCAYERPSLTQGQQLDGELTEMLAEDRARIAKRHNRKKDWMKSYMDECVKFESITKQGKK
jgi:hypothetical protein